MAFPGRVHIAGHENEEQLMAICRRLHSENGIFELEEPKVRDMLRKAFNREGGIVGIIGDGDKIEGVICMLITELWYSNEPFLNEMFLYVLPEYRKTRNAIELMNFAKWCSDQSSLPLLIGVLSNERTEGKVRLYQRQFKKPAGNFFYYKKSNGAYAPV